MIELAIRNRPRYNKDMEALQLKPARLLAKCQPAMPSAYEVEQAALRICQRLTFGGRRAPDVETAFFRYTDGTQLGELAYDPAGELTEFGAKLFEMFSNEWGVAVAYWQPNGERDVD